MLFVAEVALPLERAGQARLLEVMDRLERAGAHEIDAEEAAPTPRAFGYFDAAPTGLAEALAGLPTLGPPRIWDVEVTRREVPDGFARPFVVGPFEVRRPGAGGPPAAPHALRIAAHAAWGTGLHPTTALMLLRMAERPPEGAVLDVGTGTGILAVAALVLGAPRAVGTDVEPAALEAALTNARANGVQERLTVEGSAPEKVEGRFDLVLANIRAGPLTEMAAGLAARLAPKGRLYVSGVRAHEGAALEARFAQEGLRLEERTYARGWLCLAFEAEAA